MAGQQSTRYLTLVTQRTQWCCKISVWACHFVKLENNLKMSIHSHWGSNNCTYLCSLRKQKKKCINPSTAGRAYTEHGTPSWNWWPIGNPMRRSSNGCLMEAIHDSTTGAKVILWTLLSCKHKHMSEESHITSPFELHHWSHLYWHRGERFDDKELQEFARWALHTIALASWYVIHFKTST